MSNAVVASELMVKMAVDYASMKADMDKVAQTIGASGDQITKALSVAKAALVGFLGVASVGAFKNMILDAIEATGRFNDMAEAAGVSASQLQALSGIAKFSGVSAEQMAGAMNKLNMQLVSQGEDGKGAAAALKAIGINFSDFMQLSPDQRMTAIAKAMANYQDGSEKSAIAMALFGKSGAALVPVLKDIAEAGQLQAKVTDEQIAMADKFGDNLTRLQVSGEAWKKELAMGMLPALNDTAQSFLDVINQSGGLRDEIKKLSADGSIADWTTMAVKGFTYLMDAGSGVLLVLKSVGKYIAATAAEATELFTGIGQAISLFIQGEYKQAWEAMQGAVTKTQAVEEAFHDDLKAMWSEPTVGEKIRDRLDQYGSLRASQALVKKSVEDVKTAYAQFGEGSDELSAAQGRLAKAVSDLTAKQQDLGIKTEESKGKIDTSGLNKANKDAADKAAEAYAKQLEQYLKLAKEMETKLAMEQLELDSGNKLTDAEKEYIKVMSDVRDGKVKYNDLVANGTVKKLEDNMATAAAIKAQKDEAAAVEEAEKARAKLIETLDKEIGKLAEDNEKLKASNLTTLTGVDYSTQLEVAKIKQAAAQAEATAAALGESDAQADLKQKYLDQAKALKDRAALMEDGTAIKEAKAASAEWQKTIDNINNGLTDALMRAFESGKGFMDAFVTTLKNAFKTLILEPTIKAIIAPVGGAIGSLFGSGNAMAGTGGSGGGLGALSNIGGSLMNFLNGSSISAGASGGVIRLGDYLSTSGNNTLAGIGDFISGNSGMIGSGLGMLGNGFAGYGISKMLSGQYSAGNWVNTVAGLASAIPGIGPIAGVVGGLVNRAFGMAPKQNGEFGIQGSFSGGSAMGQAYQDWTQKGGWFRSDKSGTNFSSLDDNLKAALDLGAKGILEQTKAWAEALKLPADTLGNITASFKTKLTGDAKQDQAAIELVLQGYQNALTDQFEVVLAPFKKAGDTVVDTMQRLSVLSGLSDGINQLGGIFSKVASASLDARENIIALAGGIDKLMAAAGQFVKDYYSTGEQAGLQAKQTIDVLRQLGINGDSISSRDDFRKLVESLDLSTEQGQKQLVALLELAPQFAQLADYLKQNNTTLAEVATQAPTVAVLDQLLPQQKSTTDAVGEVVDQIKTGNRTLESIVAAIENGNMSIANGLSVLASAQQQAIQIAASTNKQIGTIANNQSLSDSAPTYTYNIGGDNEYSNNGGG